MSQSALRWAPGWLTSLLVLSTCGCTTLRGGSWWPFHQPFGATVSASSAPVVLGESKPPRAGTLATSPRTLQENSNPILPAGHVDLASGLGTPAQASRPTVTGTPLNLAPGESLAERSLELSRKLAVTEEQNLALTTHAQYLRTRLEQYERLLASAEKELKGAADEVTQARGELQQYKQDLGKLRDRLRTLEAENAATLRAVITWLERVLESERPEKPPERPREPKGPEDPDRLLEPIKPFPKK